LPDWEAVEKELRGRGVTLRLPLGDGYLDRAAAVGLNWEAVAELSEEELDRRLFAAVDTRHWDRRLPRMPMARAVSLATGMATDHGPTPPIKGRFHLIGERLPRGGVHKGVING
jgi:hypothetical protein